MRNAVLVSLTLLCVAGCGDYLRFAPNESQKQNAQLTYQLAAKADAEGAEPGSPLTEQLERGTLANMTYIGQPAEPATVEQFNEVNKAAQTAAERRPDLWDTADKGIELGIAIACLVGGGGGLAAIRFLKTAQDKSKALREIITNTELFKQTADEKAVEDFKTAQAKQSPATKELVTQIAATG